MSPMVSVCGQHVYSEYSARNKLARHRLRGDFSRVMEWCIDCQAWHVREQFYDDRPCVMHADDDCSASLPCADCPVRELE